MDFYGESEREPARFTWDSMEFTTTGPLAQGVRGQIGCSKDAKPFTGSKKIQSIPETIEELVQFQNRLDSPKTTFEAHALHSSECLWYFEEAQDTPKMFLGLIPEVLQNATPVFELEKIMSGIHSGLETTLDMSTEFPPQPMYNGLQNVAFEFEVRKEVAFASAFEYGCGIDLS
ncbi:hypothetical protein BT96DRAFT_974489 [Gymnopus androsaceus JB14]|uniref:Uncharacterized protein n=1 Tax=Gymnopus androsaceus JB14 TaxID=1447944 RepID=A0A6A4HZ39_9AGAR|nr:hypothetical protein BT96DRAFT_974489 [Gymnopus androsaceus JB14]